MSAYSGFSFEVLSSSPSSISEFSSSHFQSLKPRLGKLTTPHGKVMTPNFIFCGTKGAIKGVLGHELSSLGTEIILSNTYHLMIHPGVDLIHRQGGLHHFMNWSGPILTDSGGYQIFAMGFESVSQEIKRSSSHQGQVRKTLLGVTSKGAWFRSYWNGEKIFLSPEISIEVQRKLGADLIVQLDECTPFHIEKQETEKSMYLSMAWGDRSLHTFKQTADQYSPQALYGVIQGGIYPDLRKVSTSHVVGSDFFGVAIGGSLGSKREDMQEVVVFTCQEIYKNFQEQQKNCPIHLLGIGKISDIFYGVRAGIDTFDCVHPTRMARHGWAIIPATVKKQKSQGGDKLGSSKSLDSFSRINLNNSEFREDDLSIDPSIDTNHNGYCHYSRSYVHHLLKVKEINALTVLTRHNIFQMNRLMAEIRRGIQDDCLDEVEQFWCGS